MLLLEGEGGGKNSTGDEIKDDTDDKEFDDVVIDASGKDDGDDGEEVDGVEGVVKNGDFEEAMEEEEAESGRERGENEVEHVDEEVDRGGAGVSVRAIGKEEEKGGREESGEGGEEEFWWFEGEGFRRVGRFMGCGFGDFGFWVFRD